jgi:hypothetical protein
MRLPKKIFCALLALAVGLGPGSLVLAVPVNSTDISVPGSAAAPMAPVPSDTGSAVETIGPVQGQTPTPAEPSAKITATAAAPADTSSFWPSGRLPFHFSAKLAEIYDDNIFIQQNKTSDFITQLTLRAEIKLGDQQVVDGNYFDAFYAPTFAVYADHSGDDYINHNLELFYQHRFSRLSLSLDQTYARTTATSISVGNLTTSDVYGTTLKAYYAYSDKLEITSSVSQTVTDYDTASYATSEEWVNDDYFLYKWDSKLSFGFGPKFGFLSFAGTALQTYQQFLPRLRYIYSDKITFNLAGGLEYRQYNQAGQGDLLTGIFDFAGTYHPWLDTSLSLFGSRHYVPAYGFAGQDYLATTAGINGSQKFLKDFSFNLGFGYENDDYLLANTAFAGQGRTDNYYYITTGVDWAPNTWLLLSGSYRYQNDDSNTRAFSFNDNQLQLSVEATY